MTYITLPPPYALKTVQLAMVAVGAAALMYGGAESAEADYDGYFDGVIDVFDYDVTEYADFDLVRMTVQIENLQRYAAIDWLALFTDDGSGFSHVAYADVRGKGGDVSVDDCVSHGRAPNIPTNGVANMTACFMVNSGFGYDPSALSVGFDNHYHCYTWSDGSCKRDGYYHVSRQIVPFHEESAHCFVDNPGYCNANNIQRIDSTPTPEPEPPAPEPEPAALLYTIYHNQTGVLTLVFDQLVVASNPDRIHLIHDIDAFIEDGTAPDLGNAELNTVDNKRQSAVLAFKLSDVMRLEVMESLRTHGDLALLIDTRAVYAAEGFVDITRPDNSPLLVLDIIVVR